MIPGEISIEFETSALGILFQTPSFVEPVADYTLMSRGLASSLVVVH